MLQTFVKYCSLAICSSHFFRKLLNLPCKKKDSCIHLIYCIFFGICIHYVRPIVTLATVSSLFLLFTLLTNLTYKQPINLTIVTSFLSVGCSYSLFIISTLICSPLIIVLMQIMDNDSLLYDISFFIIAFIQIILATFLFRIERLKKGMPYLKNCASNDVGVIICIFIPFAVSFFDIVKQYSLTLLIPVIFMILSGLILIFWWKHQLTETYLSKLNERRIQEFEKQIAELKESHDILAKIIHKDNKLIPTMVFELEHILTEVGQHLNPEDKKNIQSALDKVNTIAQERKGIIQLDEYKAKSVYVTGSATIDSILQYFAAKAYSKQIIFEVVPSANVQAIIPTIISESDFRTIIADLIENAFIAVKNTSKKNILFHTQIENTIFYVDIYDSGEAFKKEVLETIGKKAITTHQNDGGSGIGYMNIFEILNHCNGDLHIKEDLDMETYTTRVRISFPLVSCDNVKLT